MTSRRGFRAVVRVLLAVILGVSVGSQSAMAAPGTPPGQVTGLVATPSANAITLRWEAPVNTGSSAISGYRITRVGTSVSSTTNLGWQTSFIVSGLDPAVSYSFTVAALNTTGAGPESAASTPTQPLVPQPPAAPSAPTAQPVSGGAIVSWSPSPDGPDPVTTYRVSVVGSALTTTVPASSHDALVTGLVDGTPYSFTVSAQNATGSSAESAPTQPVTPGPSAPSVPQDVKVSAGDGELAVSWATPLGDGGSSITGYVVRAEPGGKSMTTGPGATTATIGGLDPATSYTVSVAARNSLGEGQSVQTAPVAPRIDVQSNVVVLDADSVSHLLVVHTDGSLDFDTTPVQLSGLATGTILAAGVSAKTPVGILKEVVSTSTQAGVFHVVTKQASLDKALKDGHMSVRSRLDTSDIATFVPYQKGVRLAKPRAAAREIGLGEITVFLEADLGEAGPVEFATEGKLTIRPVVGFDSDIGLFHSSVDASAKVETETEIGLTAGKSYSWGKSVPLYSTVFKPITFSVGPIPVVLVPRMEVSATVRTADGGIQFGIVMSASEEGTYGASVHIEDGQVTAQPISEHTDVSWSQPQFYGAGTAKAGATVRMELLLYGVGGVIAEIFVGVKGSVNTSANPWWKLTWNASLDVGLGLNSVLSRFLDVGDWKTEDLISYDAAIAEAPGPFQGVILSPSTAAVPLGGSQSLSVDVWNDPFDVVTWQIPAGCGSVSKSVYKAPTTMPATGPVCRITAVHAANGLSPEAKTTMVITLGALKPGPPTIVDVMGTPAGAWLRWAAPTDTGGAPITSYVVTTNPPTGETTTTGTSTSITGLTAGQSYTFSVAAVNSAGRGVSSSPSEPVVVPDVPLVPGDVMAWGRSIHVDATTPVPLSGVDTASKISARGDVGFSLGSDGSLRSWGSNGFGQLGVGMPFVNEFVDHPVQQMSLANAVDVAASGPAGFAVTADGQAWAWGGLASYVQNGNFYGIITSPVRVPGLSGLVAIEPGMGLRADGTVVTWGPASNGQLGTGSTTDTFTPTAVPGLPTIVAISGNSTRFALGADGSVWGWGLNDVGQVGNGQVVSRGCKCQLTPVKLTGLPTMAQVSSNGQRPLAVATDGTVWGWGVGTAGALGTGVTLAKGCSCASKPVKVAGLSSVKQVADGLGTGYALKTDGSVWAWGAAGNGQLGTGATTDSPTPVKVDLPPVASIWGGDGVGYAVVK